MIGEQPRNEEIERLFDWPDAVIQLPFHSCDIDKVIGPRCRSGTTGHIRKTNVVQALMRHDWVYRWEAVLKAAGLGPMPGLLERRILLRKLMDVVLQGGTISLIVLSYRLAPPHCGALWLVSGRGFLAAASDRQQRGGSCANPLAASGNVSVPPGGTRRWAG